MIEVCFCEKAHFYFTPPPSQSKLLFFGRVEGSVEKYWGTETKTSRLRRKSKPGRDVILHVRP